MLKKRETEIYLECDMCGLLVFAGFADEYKADYIGALQRAGWKFDEQNICPLCSKRSVRS